MQFHSSTEPHEVLDWLRASAIRGGMPTLFIDRVDELLEAIEAGAELEKRGEELETAKENAKENAGYLWKALADLVKALNVQEGIHATVSKTLATAKQVLEEMQEYK